MADEKKNNVLPLIPFTKGKVEVEIQGKIYEVDPKALHTATFMVEHHQHTKGLFVYDVFSDEIILSHCPPWENKDTFKVRRCDDSDIHHMRIWLELKGVRCSKNDGWDIVICVAKKNSTNPPRDFFETLEWDGIERLDFWLADYLKCATQPSEYLRIVGSKWLIGAVSRIYEPGKKFDNVLILEGDTYAGKSLALETLATFNGCRYFTDEAVPLRGKSNDLMTLQGKLIWEMPELAVFHRSTDEDAKAFVSRRIDEYRPPYGRQTHQRPRMFVIAGSYNPKGQGLFTDTTGNRRYWPVRVGHRIDVEELKRNTIQLWAEGIVRYKKGEKTWLNEEEYAICADEQSLRMKEDALAEDIENSAKDCLLMGKKSFTVNELMEKMKIPIDRKTNAFADRIKNYLESSNYESFRGFEDGRRPVKWRRINED